jgi:integrase
VEATALVVFGEHARVAGAEAEAGLAFPVVAEAVDPVECDGTVAVDEVGEHAAPSDRRELAGIPDQDDSPSSPVGEPGQLLSNGRRNKGGGPLEPKTVRLVHGVIHKALADANRKGSVARNVADLADPPKISTRARPKMKAWNADELRRFLELTEGHDLYAAFYVKANTGMRRGELLGLTWRVIDFDNARLSVTQTVTAPDYQKVVSDVKSAHSLRTIDLNERTLVVLRSWRKRQLETYMQTGVRTDDSGFVFARPDGDPLHPDYFSQTFERLLAKMDLPRIRVHDLRHTHATLLLKEGVPVKVVSERLGHASVAFTMQVYQHVLPGMQANAAATFGEIVFGD